jgi:membrane protein YqaA with SNARE-associated domain
LGFLKSLSLKLGHALASYGGLGLFSMSFLDSSFVPLPAINDLGLIVLASQRPARAPFYALMSTVGSLLGCYVIYGIARGAGKLVESRSTSTKGTSPPSPKGNSALSTKETSVPSNKGTSVPPTTGTRVRHWLERNDFVTMLVMSLLPPPAPLKVSVVTAGALRMNALHFGVALLLGRSLRFAADAWLGVRYGAQGGAYLKKNIGWVSLVIILAIIGLTLLSRWWKARRAARPEISG